MDISARWNITRIVVTMCYLMAGWLLFTGSFAPYNLILGLVCSSGVAFATYTLFIEQHEAARRTLVPRAYLLLAYAVIILAKMYAAAFRLVPKAISCDIQPRIVHFRSRLRSDLARIVLANSITLTPGTVTLDVSGDHLIVHWLDAKTSHSHHAHKLIAGQFERWLRRIWL